MSIKTQIGRAMITAIGVSNESACFKPTILCFFYFLCLISICFASGALQLSSHLQTCQVTAAAASHTTMPATCYLADSRSPEKKIQTSLVPSGHRLQIPLIRLNVR